MVTHQLPPPDLYVINDFCKNKKLGYNATARCRAPAPFEATAAPDHSCKNSLASHHASPPTRNMLASWCEKLPQHALHFIIRASFSNHTHENTRLSEWVYAPLPCLQTAQHRSCAAKDLCCFLRQWHQEARLLQELSHTATV